MSSSTTEEKRSETLCGELRRVWVAHRFSGGENQSVAIHSPTAKAMGHPFKRAL
jgi:hypothetical protein